MTFYLLRRSTVIRAFLAAILIAAGAGSAYAIGPAEVLDTYGDKATYTIIRNGKKIGTHTLSFTPQNGELTVDIVSDIKVRVLKIPVYSFYYVSKEQWSGDQLLSLTSSVTEKGTTKRTRYEYRDGVATMTDTNGETTTGNVNFGSNHWNNAVLNEQLIFNTLTGRANKVSVSEPKTEQLSINNREIETTHHVYSDELQAEVWYDTTGRWVQLSFKGEDGSVIQYISNGFDQ